MTSGPGPIGRPSDAAMWASIAATLRDVVLPGIDDVHHRQVVVQMVGLAAYARDREPDPSARRVGELADGLDALARHGNSMVTSRWSPESSRQPADVMTAVGEVLAACVDRTDPDPVAAQETLRPMLVRHLTEDLAAEDVLLNAFRGRLPDG